MPQKGFKTVLRDTSVPVRRSPLSGAPRRFFSTVYLLFIDISTSLEVDFDTSYTIRAGSLPPKHKGVKGEEKELSTLVRTELHYFVDSIECSYCPSYIILYNILNVARCACHAQGYRREGERGGAEHKDRAKERERVKERCEAFAKFCSYKVFLSHVRVSARQRAVFIVSMFHLQR
jgi:hypothetical protein